MVADGARMQVTIRYALCLGPQYVSIRKVGGLEGFLLAVDSARGLVCERHALTCGSKCMCVKYKADSSARIQCVAGESQDFVRITTNDS